MKNIENILNELVAKMLTEGSAAFSQDGLNIKTSYDNGCLKIAASFESPKVDEAKELRDSFEAYIKSLHDDFFLEVVESFEGGQLKEIQDNIDSDNIDYVKGGINIIMSRIKEIAQSKIKSLNVDIKEAEKELSELIEIRDSYIHVINKKF